MNDVCFRMEMVVALPALTFSTTASSTCARERERDRMSGEGQEGETQTNTDIEKARD